MENKTHYVCTGECGGVAVEPGVCQADAEECSHSGEDLEPCDCTDGLHREVLASSEENEEE